MQQGNALASRGFCAAIHPDVVALDTRLAASGGAAKFDMDDGYAIGPPEVVFEAVADFAIAIADSGLELRIQKCRCFSFGVALLDHSCYFVIVLSVTIIITIVNVPTISISQMLLCHG